MPEDSAGKGVCHASPRIQVQFPGPHMVGAEDDKVSSDRHTQTMGHSPRSNKEYIFKNEHRFPFCSSECHRKFTLTICFSNPRT